MQNINVYLLQNHRILLTKGGGKAWKAPLYQNKFLQQIQVFAQPFILEIYTVQSRV